MWSKYYYLQEVSKKDNNKKDESLNNYKNLFSKYKYNLPSLKDALYQMFKSKNINDKKIDELIEDILDKCKKTIKKNEKEIKKKYKNITEDDAYIICSYTCESQERDFSPYRILNRNLVETNRQSGVENVSKYLYILLKSLRKLPKYKVPPSKYLYRCISQKVNLEKNDFKTFWGFTSTSNDKETTYKFLESLNDNKTGTLYKLYGKIWGYKLDLFNSYGEKEILLEPERKFKVESIKNGEVIKVKCKIDDNPSILEEIDNQQNMIIEEKIDENLEIIKNYISKYIATFEKDNNKSGIGILCGLLSFLFG